MVALVLVICWISLTSLTQSKKRQLEPSNVFGTASKYFLPTRPFLNAAKFRSGHLGSCSKGGLRTVVRGSYTKPSRLRWWRRKEEASSLFLLLLKKKTTSMPTEAPAAVAMREKIFIVVARPGVVVHSKSNVMLVRGV